MGRDCLRILVLSFYYPPDLSAGSFRTAALVKALRDALSDEGHVDVVTAAPNRYKTFVSGATFERETYPGLEIRRVVVPNHRSGMLDQSVAFAYFATGVRRHVRSYRYDIVYATSSRLMTAALGAWIAKRQGAKLYLDIRDIFVETINSILPKGLTLLARRPLSFLERWTFHRADKVNLVSEGFKSYFTERYPHLHYSFFTNGVDDEFADGAASLNPPRMHGAPVTVVYAGNIGEGQGLHVIVPDLARRMHGRVNFKLIGDGGRRRALEAALNEAAVTNVELLSPMKREQLMGVYKEADVLFLHLNEYNAFKRVLPSKIFEYAALGKPIWAGVSGYAAEFIRSEISNAVVFRPCDAIQAQAVFSGLSLIERERSEFVEKFSRAKIMRAMASDLLGLKRKID